MKIRNVCRWFRAPIFSIGIMASAIQLISWMSIDVLEKLFVALAILVFSLVIDGLWISKFLRNKSVVINLGNGHKLKIVYGDILTREGFVTIPVNDCFDSNIGPGLIQSRSIHGQFLERLGEQGKLIFDTNVSKYLREQRITPKKAGGNRPKGGKTDVYEIGTIALIENAAKDLKGKFLLVASTETNFETGSVEGSLDYVKQSVECILDYIRNYGDDVNIPLMGSGFAKTGVSQIQILCEIVSTIIRFTRGCPINADVIIVLHKKLKDELPLYTIREIWG